MYYLYPQLEQEEHPLPAAEESLEFILKPQGLPSISTGATDCNRFLSITKV
jgi:hypothetical protein